MNSSNKIIFLHNSDQYPSPSNLPISITQMQIYNTLLTIKLQRIHTIKCSYDTLFPFFISIISPQNQSLATMFHEYSYLSHSEQAKD